MKQNSINFEQQKVQKPYVQEEVKIQPSSAQNTTQEQVTNHIMNMPFNEVAECLSMIQDYLLQNLFEEGNYVEMIEYDKKLSEFEIPHLAIIGKTEVAPITEKSREPTQKAFKEFLSTGEGLIPTKNEKELLLKIEKKHRTIITTKNRNVKDIAGKMQTYAKVFRYLVRLKLNGISFEEVVQKENQKISQYKEISRYINEPALELIEKKNIYPFITDNQQILDKIEASVDSKLSMMDLSDLCGLKNGCIGILRDAKVVKIVEVKKSKDFPLKLEDFNIQDILDDNKISLRNPNAEEQKLPRQIIQERREFVDKNKEARQEIIKFYIENKFLNPNMQNEIEEIIKETKGLKDQYFNSKKAIYYLKYMQKVHKNTKKEITWEALLQNQFPDQFKKLNLKQF